MMQKAPHFQAAYDLGGDVAEAEAHGDPLPFPKTPTGPELWQRIMGDAARSDWPTNTLRQLRAEYEAGITDHA